MISKRVFRDENDREVYFDAYVYEPMSEQPELLHRPAVIILPGGAYEFCSEREGEPVGNKFAAEGYNYFILHYSIRHEEVFPRQLNDTAWAISELRLHPDEYMIDPDRISVIGFSAGGHLAASIGVYFDTEYSGNFGVSNRPDAVILVYPVITSGLDTSDMESMKILMNTDNITPEMNRVLSLEKHVRHDMPPVFIASSYADDDVQIENSLMFATELRKKLVPFEMHVFSQGEHGFSVSQKITSHGNPGLECARTARWTELAIGWLDTVYIKKRS